MASRSWAVVALLAGGVAVAAPVPKPPPPDPLGYGYLGFVPAGDTLGIGSIEPGTPAHAAGLRAGDVFVRVGDYAPKGFPDMVRHVVAIRPGTRVRVTVRRGDVDVTVAVLLGDRPGNLSPFPHSPDHPAPGPRP